MNATAVVGSQRTTVSGVDGAIRDVFFFDCALTAAEIRYMMVSRSDALPVVAGPSGFALTLPDSRRQAALEMRATSEARLAGQGTVVTWVFPSPQSPGQPLGLIQLRAGDDQQLTLWAPFDDDRSVWALRLSWESGAVVTNWNFPAAALQVRAWQRLTMTWNGVELAFFIEEQRLASLPRAQLASWTSVASIRVGACALLGSVDVLPFVGRLDEISVWSEALDSNQRGATKAKLTGLEKSLLGYWSFDDGAVRSMAMRNQAAGANALSAGELRVLAFDQPDTGFYHAMFLGGSEAPVSVESTLTSGELRLLELPTYASVVCSPRARIESLPDRGKLLEAVCPAAIGDSCQPSERIRGASVDAAGAIPAPFLFFLAPPEDNGVGYQTSLSFRTTCDQVESVNTVRLVINVLPTALVPHLKLTDRVAFSLDGLRFVDPDEDEDNTVMGFELRVDGVRSPAMTLPTTSSAVTVTMLRQNDSSRGDAVSIRGSGSSSDLNTLSRGLVTEVNQQNPLKATFEIALDQPGGQAQWISLAHKINTRPVISAVEPSEMPQGSNGIHRAYL
ncbi:hypothetical protein ATCC90586_003569 [Pythium insidiosum]|nr:hypothetical protein ATCC90586_003569 [Pythium insidiosum]